MRREYYKEHREERLEYGRRYYAANREKIKKDQLARQLDRVAKKRKAVDAYKQSKGCIDCGSHDDLELDHRDPADKLFTVSRAIVSRSWAKIWAEVEKCDVRCRACHQRRHAQDRARAQLHDAFDGIL